MSLYPHQQDMSTANNGRLPQNQLLDPSAELLAGLDMGMELDMELAHPAPPGPGIDPRTFHHVGPPVENSISRQSQDLEMGGASAGSVNGSYGPPGALPSQHQEQQLLQQMQDKIRERLQLQHDQQDAARGGAGAGPLPAGFGLAAPATTSTLTEFTKRRNWSQRIIEELKDLLHILTPDGRVLYASPSCKTLTGYESNDLVGKFMGEFVHPDDSGIFMREFNESIASGNPLRFYYRFKKEDGEFVIFECDGHPHISAGDGSTQPLGYGQSPIQQISMNLPHVCRGFFMMARPYPTKNAALLDSFLEHKIENERLMKRIEELKREEDEDKAEQERIYRDHISNPGGVTPSTGTQDTKDKTQNYQGMPPPAKPTISNIALTRQNLDSALSAQKPDSMADKMSRYEANSNHLESIEMLTGLQYRDGERSHGISTGDSSPALIRGDAGIAILLDRDRDASKKEKKKLKIVDEYVCSDCGTLDSPEWRKGPKGPKTLCNACGLRWAKKEKKRGGGDDSKDLTPTSATGYGQAGMVGMSMPPPPMLLQHHSSGSMSQ